MSLLFPNPTLISVQGASLEVFEAGRENAGNPIVLCHGWPEHAFSWRHQIPALVEAGYHVLVPNQRGYGRSHRPADVEAYDLDALTGDLVGLLDHFGYERAVFVGHDWGASVVWGLALLHPSRVDRLVALSVPYQPRTEVPWVDFLEGLMGSDYYFVDFNRRPGVADAVLDAHPRQFLRNLFRRPSPDEAPLPGNAMIALARRAEVPGEPLLTDAELDVFVDAFQETGFGPSIHWYRNVDRNWHRLADIDPIVPHRALMVYGAHDAVAPSPVLEQFVPNVEVHTLDSGHWIQQERPKETNRVLLDWLQRTTP